MYVFVGGRGSDNGSELGCCWFFVWGFGFCSFFFEGFDCGGC